MQPRRPLGRGQGRGGTRAELGGGARNGPLAVVGTVVGARASQIRRAGGS